MALSKFVSWVVAAAKRKFIEIKIIGTSAGIHWLYLGTTWTRIGAKIEIPTRLGKTSKQMKNIDLVTLLSKWSPAFCILENAGKVTLVIVSIKNVKGILANFCANESIPTPIGPSIPPKIRVIPSSLNVAKKVFT